MKPAEADCAVAFVKSARCQGEGAGRETKPWECLVKGQKTPAGACTASRALKLGESTAILVVWAVTCEWAS